jgi:hypothetical protein
MRPSHPIRLAPAFVLWSLALSAADAAAAPQVLGLVASNGLPVPLVCDRLECKAQASAFCLQEARDAPPRETAYRLADGGRVHLLFTNADGGTRRVDAADLLHISTLIGFTSVELSLPRAAFEALGAVAVAVEVGPGVSLLPIEAAGDPDPQTPEEIALAMGPVRRLASAAFEVPGPRSDAARIANFIINALPPGLEETPAVRLAAWGETVTPELRAATTAEGLAAAAELYGQCLRATETRSALSLKGCLEMKHAELMVRENREFWRSLGGS